jgi:hypothetical protein
LSSGVDEKEHLWDEAVGRAIPKVVLSFEALIIRLTKGRIEAGVAIVVVMALCRAILECTARHLGA